MTNTHKTSLIDRILQHSHALYLIILNFLLASLTFMLVGFLAPHLSAAPSLIVPLGATLFKAIAPAVAGFLAGSIPVVGNPVNALFSLILILALCVTLLIQNGAEYSGFVVAIVQIGGVSILFLFVIISLNLYRSSRLEAIDGAKAIAYYLAPAILLLSSLRATFYHLFTTRGVNVSQSSCEMAAEVEQPVGDITTVARLLFGELSPLFILAGLLLLTAMLGAIVLATATIEPTTEQKLLFLKYNSVTYERNKFLESVRYELSKTVVPLSSWTAQLR